jgi:hypothetical protein
MLTIQQMIPAEPGYRVLYAMPERAPDADSSVWLCEKAVVAWALMADPEAIPSTSVEPLILGEHGLIRAADDEDPIYAAYLLVRVLGPDDKAEEFEDSAQVLIELADQVPERAAALSALETVTPHA